MAEKLGPTGNYPRGKLNKDDMGEMNMAVEIEGDCVKIDFGTPTTWVGLPKETAITFANIILKLALKLP